MEIMLRLSRSGTATVDEYQCIRFSFVRDRYLPYSTLRATMVASRGVYNDPCKVQFYMDGKLMHEGIIEQLDAFVKEGTSYLTVVSKGFSAALMHNQPVPGIYPAATLSSLMTMYHLPYVTYQDDVTESRYMFVKDNTSMWDMLTHYTFKLNGGYPYVTVPNHVCVTPKTNPPEYIVQTAQLIRKGDCTNLTRMLSRVDMADASGEYGVYSLENQEALRCNVVRIKQITLDKQYLSEPELALQYRIQCSMQKLRARYYEYMGYCGEDIGDIVTVIGFTSAYVGRIELSGEGDDLRTLIYCYQDPFCNRS